MCENEKRINNFFKLYTDCKICNSIGSLKHYSQNKDKKIKSTKDSLGEQ